MNRRDFLRMALASPLLAACGKLIGDDKMATLEELMKPMIDASVARGEMSAANAGLLRDKLRYQSGVTDVTGKWIKPGTGVASFDEFEFRKATLKSGGQMPSEGWRVRASSDTSVATGATPTPINFDTPDFDSADDFDDFGFFDTSSPTRITIPAGQTGYYYIRGEAAMVDSLNDNESVILRIWLESPPRSLSDYPIAIKASHASATYNIYPRATTSTTYYLLAGDYLTFQVLHDNASSRLVAGRTFGFRWR